MDLNEEYEDTPINFYRPNEVDEYLVIVNLPEDWEEVHKDVSKDDEHIAPEKRKTKEHEENKYHKEFLKIRF